MPHEEDDPAPVAVLRELLDCTELNLDDMEEHTRVVIQKARSLLDQQRMCM